MKAVVQRVERAAVRVVGEAEPTGAIDAGMLVLLGVAKGDDEAVARRMAERLRGLRIFQGDDGRMSEAVGERGILVVSNFTLCADTRKGRRPSFTGAAEPALAEALYELVAAELGAERGRFGGDMRIELVADGPVTIELEVGGRPA
ncbi:MAG: D-tyrosyl-tRNA(Tyr) deacylase [Solirubrobacteraceae bacterium]|nr:D-tyrosyl-tRNA(Tyr) deacylase [Solirubrobacteraceae bacterium]